MAAEPVTEEFEDELQRERARWVRRRFLWLMGLTLVISVPVLAVLWATMEEPGEGREGRGVEAGWIRFAWATLATGLYVLCLIAVLAYRNRPGSIYFPSRLALAVMALTGLLAVPIERVAAGLEGTIRLEEERPSSPGGAGRGAMSGFMEGFQAGAGLSGFARADGADGSSAATQRAEPTTQRLAARPVVKVGIGAPAGPGGAAGGRPGTAADQRWVLTVWSPGLRTALMAVWVALSVHLLSCLFMPWTLRESLVPAVAILSGYVVVVAYDLMVGQISWWWVVIITPLLLAALTPGTVLCWWRYSRFRGEYRLQFESGRYQQLRDELAAARRIHEGCLPAPVSEGPVRVSYVYRPMREIGGDLLVCRELPGGRRLLVVMDVTGHGITAALTVNRLLGELDRILGQSRESGPAEMLSALNRYAWLMLAHHGLYLSAVVAVVDPVAGTVCYASGGHPSGYVSRREHKGEGEVDVEDLESTSTLLGVLPPDEYDAEQRVVRLEPGEVLMFCTDGATESRRPDGSRLRTAGVRELFREVVRSGTVGPERVAEAMVLRLEKLNPGEREDDLLVVCVHLSGVDAVAGPG